MYHIAKADMLKITPITRLQKLNWACFCLDKTLWAFRELDIYLAFEFRISDFMGLRGKEARSRFFKLILEIF